MGVRRYIDILTIIINFPPPLVLAPFFGSNIPNSLFIFKTFFGLVCVSFVQYNYSKRCKKNIGDYAKIII